MIEETRRQHALYESVSLADPSATCPLGQLLAFDTAGRSSASIGVMTGAVVDRHNVAAFVDSVCVRRS